MEVLNNILSELGISKVNLAKYLGVSRQMVYNYLELENLNKWPKDKKIALFKLLDIDDGDEDTIKNIKMNTEYLLEVSERLNKGLKSFETESYLDLKGLKKESQQLVGDINYLIKDKLENDDNDEYYYALLYFHHLLQSIDNVPEIKYLLAYMSKVTGFTKPKEFKFNKEKQYMFEGIVHSAVSLYSSGTASEKKVLQSHQRFVEEIERKQEERLSRTQELNSVRIQALRELGYDDINTENATEVLEKMAEIETRRA